VIRVGVVIEGRHQTRPPDASLFFRRFLFLDCHVFQFARFENIAAFLAFDIFGFFIARDDPHPRMLALFWSHFLLGQRRRLARRHKRAECSSLEREYFSN
jgi:hypothetical protein